MKQTKQKRQNKTLKLPQIHTPGNSSTNKSSFAHHNQQTSRPLSSNKIDDLSKKLFNQLDQYEQTHNKSKNINKKDINLFSVDLEIPSLKKLQKSMPQTYSRLMESRKKEQGSKQVTHSPFSHANMVKNNPLSQKQASKSKKLKTTTSQVLDKSKNIQNSFTIAERQVQNIFNKYLEEEGLQDLKNVQSSADLKDLNKELNATEGEINGLWKDYYDNIKKIGYSYANTQNL